MGQTDPNSEPRKRRPSTDIPLHPLRDALKVPETIESANAGQPYPPAETALALGVSPGSSSYWRLLSSSLRYGLTLGSYKSERLELTELGRSISAPTSELERSRALIEAALAPPTFQAIYQHFRGKKLPEERFLMNTVVREFGVPTEVAEDCVKVFRSNMQFVRLVNVGPTGEWLASEPSPTASAMSETSEDAASVADNGVSEAPADDGTEPPVRPPTPLPIGQMPSAFFVGHGRNKKPLEQLTRILAEYGIVYKVAVDEANHGRPISEKVAETMRQCGAAILIFTADQEFRDVDGNAVWRPSENVVYELGAASMLYGKRIIIFKEEGVEFPTNFRDIGHISFSKDDLASRGIDLVRELIAFGVMKLTIAA